MKQTQETLNQMLVDMRDRYQDHVNVGWPKRKADVKKYAMKTRVLVVAIQCLIAGGATTENFDGWHFENSFDIKTYWPNFLCELDVKEV